MMNGLDTNIPQPNGNCHMTELNNIDRERKKRVEDNLIAMVVVQYINLRN